MTGVRVRSAVDRSTLGLSSRLPEVATGFSGVGLIGSTHATQRVARRFTDRGRHLFKTYEAAHVVGEVRHSDLASRANDADGAHHLGSHGVLLITKYMLDAGAHLRARRRRISGLLGLTEFEAWYRDVSIMAPSPAFKLPSYSVRRANSRPTRSRHKRSSYSRPCRGRVDAESKTTTSRRAPPTRRRRAEIGSKSPPC
jgi:hypothetical protein